MQDVTLVELVPEGIRLRAFFEPPIDVPAVSPQRNLLKHRVILESIQNGEDEIERNRETADGDPHWLEHDEEPAEECRHWAEKAAVESADILAAFEAPKGVNQALAAAPEKLGGATSRRYSH